MGNKRILEALNALLDEGLRKCDIIESLMDSIDDLNAEVRSDVVNETR